MSSASKISPAAAARKSRRRSVVRPPLLEVMRRIGVVLTSLLLLLLLVGVVLLALAPRSPATPSSVENVAALESFLRDLVASGNPPGISVAAIRDGSVVYQRGFGLADGPRGVQATPATIYKWWSLTKILTATAILQLHERGRLSLDDPVRDHLAFFQVSYEGGEAATITIRQLLNHSSGLRNLRLEVLQWTHPEGESGREPARLLEEVFPEFAQLRFEPGRRGVYSNFGYMVLGEIVEAASGQRYEDYVVENILEPLGMKETNFVATEAMLPHMAVGSHPVVDFQTVFLPAIANVGDYIREIEDGRIWFERFYFDAPAYGGAIGPVTDAAKLVLCLLNRGELGGRRILEPETVEMMLEEGQVRAGPSNVAPPSHRRRGMRHGLGWWVFPGKEGTMYEHTGAGPGFAALLRLYPERSLGIVVLANGTNLDREGIADLIAQQF